MNWLQRHFAQLAARLSPGVSRILGNAGWLLFDRILRRGIGLVVIVVLARYLGPEEFGLYNYAIAFVVVFGSLATLGLDRIVIRDVVQEFNARFEILGTAFFLRLSGALLAVLMATASTFVLNPDSDITRLLVGLMSLAIVFQAFDTIDLWFQSQIQSKFTVIAKNSAMVLVAAINLGLIWWRAPLVAFAITYILEFALSAVGLVLTYHLNNQAVAAWRFRPRRARVLLKDSWPLLLATISSILYTRIDQVMIGNMIDDYSVGIYAAATRIFELFFPIIMILSSSVYPRLVELYNQNQARFYQVYEWVTALLTLFSLAAFLAVFIFNRQLISILYGASYLEASTVLTVQVVAIIVVFNAGLRSSYLTISNNQKIILITTVISAILNIVMNYYLIPIYGIIGAAIATLLTRWISLFFSNLFFRSTRQIFLIQVRALFLIPIWRYLWKQMRSL